MYAPLVCACFAESACVQRGLVHSTADEEGRRACAGPYACLTFVMQPVTHQGHTCWGLGWHGRAARQAGLVQNQELDTKSHFLCCTLRCAKQLQGQSEVCTTSWILLSEC